MQGVDEIHTALRTGVNLGVYSSYQTFDEDPPFRELDRE